MCVWCLPACKASSTSFFTLSVVPTKGGATDIYEFVCRLLFCFLCRKFKFKIVSAKNHISIARLFSPIFISI